MKKKQISHLPPIKQLNLTRRHFVKATSALAVLVFSAHMDCHCMLHPMLMR